MCPEPASPSTPFSTEGWRSSSAVSWLAQADRLEAMLEPVLEPIFEHAGLVSGERVLDVGCGRGATTFRAALEVGPGGTVTAVEVSEALVEAAVAMPLPVGAAPIEWIAADAQRADLPAEYFDVVISRFGVMFFDDAVEAFANLCGSVRSGGRLAVATWRPRDTSPFQSAGYDAIVVALRAKGYEVEPSDPASGPFSFGVDPHVRDVLTAAGWHDVVVHPVEMPLLFAGPGASPAEAVEVAMGMSGLVSFLAPFDDNARDLAAAALHDVYSRHHDGTGVRLQAAMTVITARN